MREALGVMGMFCILIMVAFTHLYTFVKTHQTVHLKGANFIVCKLNLNKPDFTKQKSAYQKLWKVVKVRLKGNSLMCIHQKREVTKK